MPESPIDPFIWIEPAAADDPVLYKQTEREVRQRLQRIFRDTGSEADDLIQTTLSRVLEKLQKGISGEFADARARKGYVDAFGHNVLREWKRSRQRSEVGIPDLEQVGMILPRQIADEDCRELFWEGLLLCRVSLSETEDEMIALLIAEAELPIWARFKGLPYGAVRVRASRARQHLRKLMEAWEKWPALHSCIGFEFPL